MIEEKGRITACTKDKLVVETEIKTTCSGCSQKNHCGTGLVARSFSNKTSQMLVDNQEQLKLGDEVKIGVEESALVKLSLIIYMLPLLVMLLTASLGSLLLPKVGMENELWLVLVTFIATALTYRLIKAQLGAYLDNAAQPQISPINRS